MNTLSNNAIAYADQLARDIWERTEGERPFGLRACDVCEAGPEDLCEPVDGVDDITDIYFGGHERDADALDYLSDALDIQYLVNGDGSYRHARILIAFGGPNAWIDTRLSVVEVFWGSDSAVRDLPPAFITALDDACEELWESRC